MSKILDLKEEVARALSSGEPNEALAESFGMDKRRAKKVSSSRAAPKPDDSSQDSDK